MAMIIHMSHADHFFLCSWNWDLWLTFSFYKCEPNSICYLLNCYIKLVGFFAVLGLFFLPSLFFQYIKEEFQYSNYEMVLLFIIFFQT